jgi:hypothetical protein
MEGSYSDKLELLSTTGPVAETGPVSETLCSIPNFRPLTVPENPVILNKILVQIRFPFSFGLVALLKAAITTVPTLGLAITQLVNQSINQSICQYVSDNIRLVLKGNCYSPDDHHSLTFTSLL